MIRKRCTALYRLALALLLPAPYSFALRLRALRESVVWQLISYFPADAFLVNSAWRSLNTFSITVAVSSSLLVACWTISLSIACCNF